MKDIQVNDIRRLLPRRAPGDNKTKGGKTLIIAGSEGMWGAAILCSTAAARVGSGYVTLFADFRKASFPALTYPDFLTADSQKKKISDLKFTSVAVGPGLGAGPRTVRILKDLLRRKEKNVVVDADALTVAAKNSLGPFPKTWILTPHEGELSRLLKISSEEIRADRQQAVIKAAKKWKCLVVLKGHHTLVCDGKNVFRCRTGNAALAKAGTGDVLTGMIAGFLAQGLEPLAAAQLGVFVHGSLADEWIKKNDPLALVASDLLKILPPALLKLRKKIR